jgi:hypothetical protein
MTGQTSDPIDTSLATLDGVGASEGFTERVLEKLGSRRRQRRRRRRRALAVAASSFIIAAVALPFIFGSVQQGESEIIDEAEALIREHARLERELEELRSSARETAPVLYLGGNDDMDLVLDLGPIILQTAPASVYPHTNSTESLEL